MSEIEQDLPREAPVAERERIGTLDLMRGIAVLAILFPNVAGYGQPSLAYFWPPALAGGMTVADQVVWLVQFTFIDGKFRGLFTLLFGAGMWLFLERSEARGAGPGLQMRRLLVLLAFGLAHYFLVWHGDILTLYAVWGLVALGSAGWPRERQLGVGLTMAVAGALLMTSLTAERLAPMPGTESASSDVLSLKQAGAELELIRNASYPAIVRHNLAEETDDLVRSTVIVGVTETIGLILIGMALFRYGLFTGEIDPARLRRWGWTGLAIGLPLSLAAGLWPVLAGFPFDLTLFVFSGIGTVLQLVTVLGLVSLLAAWAPRIAPGWLGQRLSAAGRMAFSNYLGTSLVMMLLFHGWAFGLYGQLHRIALLPVVLGGWAAMLLWSPWWLARFRFGPLEWVWRCLTYGQWMPLRR